MIEIAIHEIANYDMVQILQKAEQGEKVALVYNGVTFDVVPNINTPKEMIHDKNVHLSDLFDKLNVALPKDYQFDREEANAR